MVTKLVIFGNGLVCALAVLAAALGPSPDGRYGLYVASGVPAALVVAAAGGSIVSLSADGRVAVAVSDQSGFRSRLAAAGAFVVFNPALARGCNP